MQHQLKMVFWKGDKYWLKMLIEYPQIMTQGETIEEPEENLRDAFREIILEDVPNDFQVKDITV
mgnify:CR=1 FL=1